jgi:hypothetical protein
VRELEAARAAAVESGGLLEAARREAKALRGKLDQVGLEKEAEQAGAERAREVGARLRRELAEVKAALKTAEAAQVTSFTRVCECSMLTCRSYQLLTGQPSTCSTKFTTPLLNCR